MLVQRQRVDLWLLARSFDVHDRGQGMGVVVLDLHRNVIADSGVVVGGGAGGCGEGGLG